ncbi:MAG: hypothetical protein QG622_3230 [Actinomycetota bacterium]|nr:hypothetical protein [Actinomycetota bacterium]
MGEEISATGYSREQRQLYRAKVQLCLEVFGQMLAGSTFNDRHALAGLEVELNLVDGEHRPFPGNLAVLEEIADPAFQTELGAFNIEFNAPPRPLHGDGARALEEGLRQSLDAAEAKAGRRGSHLIMIGILPTLMPEHLQGTGWMSRSPRYAALNDSILTARGEDFQLDISGVERLNAHSPTLAPEAACTSVQLHLQVAPTDFARTWNAAQLLAGPQLALGANSPYFFGKELWRETRIELFTQSTDTRPPELKNQGVRPRVWFGERWITSIFDLLEENVRYFPALLPEISDEDPVAEYRAGRTPHLRELRLHNGTVYRWNRPVYDVVDGRPHVRVENRVLPAGPTVIDVMANAAFYYGAVHVLRTDERPLWSQLRFPTAADNFHDCARHGLDAVCYWPGVGEIPASELLLRRLIPLAHEGLDRIGVDRDIRERLLGVVEDRVKSGRNGASWQVSAVHALEEHGLTRREALTRMLAHYCEGMHSGQPVHTWPLPA